MNRNKSLISKVVALSALAISLAIVPITHSILTSPIEESALAWTGTQTPSVTSAYYSQADGLTGSALKSKLASFNKPGSTSYDWSRYEAGDEAYNNSSYITCIYTRHDIPKSAHVGSGYSWDSWNREHIYTQTAFPNSDKDNHNIFACEGQINNNRGNLKFGEVAHTSANQQTVHGHLTDNYRSGSYFEPCDEAKGEVARAVLYTSLYYGYSISSIFETEALALKWHAQFPVSQRDIYRNNAIYPLQGNRNPFVDRPSYANLIYNPSTPYTGADPLGGGSSSTAPNTITLSPSTSSIAVGGNVTLNVTVDSGSTSVAWSTNNSGVATVTNGVVTGVSAGTATITATSTLNSSVKGTATITVKALSTLTISGTPSITAYSAGQAFNPAGLTVTAKYTDNSTVNVTSSVIWTPNPLTVGTTSVTGSYGGKTVSVSGLTVTAPIGYSLITNASQLTIGDSIILAYKATSATAGALSGTFLSSISDATFSTDLSTITNPGSSMLFTLGGTSGAWTFTNSGGSLLYSSTAKNVNFSSNGTATWSISVSANGDAVVSNTNQNCGVLQYNTGDPRFTTYVSGQASIHLYHQMSAPSQVAVSGVSLSPSTLNLTVGNNSNLTASISPSNATNKSVSWSSNNSSVASVSNGTVTANAVGSATITVKTSDGNFTDTCSVVVVAATLNNVSVSNTKTYHPGDTITKSDITVTLNYSGGGSSATSNFTFASEGYQFTYADANGGGSNTAKQFAIVYEGTSYNFSTNVSRVAYQVPSGANVSLSSSAFNSSTVSKSSSTPSSTSVTIGGVDFTVTTNAYVYSSCLSFGKEAGSIINTNAFGSDLTSISVAQKSGFRSDGVLSISKNGTNWVAYSAGELASGGYRFFKYAYTSSGSNYSNIESISYALSGQDNPANVANYVMYADTNNQCTTKLSDAVAKLNSMSAADKNTFWTSDDYVIATARERLLAWSRHEGAELTYSGGVFQTSNAINASMSNQNNNLIIIFVIGLISLTAVGGYFFLKKKKEN